MTLTRFVTPTVLAAALALTASPAAAQHRGGGRVSHGSVSRGTAVARSTPVYRGGGFRGSVVVRGGIFRGGGFYYRPYYSGFYNYRPYYTFRPHFSLGIGLWAGYPVNWSAYFGYGYPYYYGYYPAAPYYSGYYGYPYSSAYPSYPPAYYDDPPSTSPPDYQSNYPPNNSGYGSAYPQQPQQPGGTIAMQPGTEQQASGGVTFEVTPATASVFVDGTYMGTGAEFGPTMQPLGLSVGRHHVEIRAEGYRTMSFDADVTAGQVTPYRASLQRQ